MWHRREERGSVVVEFALVLPILVLLLFGMIEFGRGYNARIELVSAVREGARAGALGKNLSTIADTTKAAAPGLKTTDITVASTTLCSVTPQPADITVTATYPFHYEIPLFRSSTITLTAKAVMRCGA